jgi:alkylated DNA repair protein (DNA oxidative demethylase)
MHGVVAKRRIVHFGVRYAFTSHQLSPAPAIPQTFKTIRARAAAIADIDPNEFSEVLVTEYRAGAGIGWHRDAPPFGIIAGISLAENRRLRSQRGRKSNRKTASIDLPRRSMYLRAGEVRSEWEHSIPAISHLRYSITFRTVKPGSPVVHSF